MASRGPQILRNHFLIRSLVEKLSDLSVRLFGLQRPIDGFFVGFCIIVINKTS